MTSLFGTTPNRSGLQCVSNARRNDPDTSKEAGEKVEASGKAERQRREILAGVTRHPGRTTDELAKLLGMDRYDAARRAPEVKRAGLIRYGEKRRSEVSGNNAVTLWLTETE